MICSLICSMICPIFLPDCTRLHTILQKLLQFLGLTAGKGADREKPPAKRRAPTRDRLPGFKMLEGLPLGGHGDVWQSALTLEI